MDFHMQVIAQLFDKLDLDRDGRISFAEFLHLFQNVRPGKGEQTHQPVVCIVLKCLLLDTHSSL